MSRILRRAGEVVAVEESLAFVVDVAVVVVVVVAMVCEVVVVVVDGGGGFGEKEAAIFRYRMASAAFASGESLPVILDRIWRFP